MDKLTDMLGFAAQALPGWLSAAASVIAAASTVTALTPTPADDRWLGKIYRLVEILALNIGYAKDKAPLIDKGQD